MFIIDPVILMWLTFGLIAIAIGFYISEELSLEITSLGVIGTLLILFLRIIFAWPDRLHTSGLHVITERTLSWLGN